METFKIINLTILILSLVVAVGVIMLMINRAKKSSRFRFERRMKQHAEEIAPTLGLGKGVYAHKH